MTLKRWTDLFFGAILPTPIGLLFGGYALLWGMGVFSSDFVDGVSNLAIGTMVVMSIVLLWYLALCGAEPIVRRPILRWLSVVILILILGGNLQRVFFL